MKYLLNVSARTVHDAHSTDGRCRITQMQDGNKMFFDFYDEALNYLPKGKKNTAPCSFCLKKDYVPPAEEREK